LGGVFLNKLEPPSGILSSTKEWVNSRVEPFYSKSMYQDIYFKTPFKKRFHNPPARYPKILDGGNVALIANGRVWGRNGAIISPDNKLIWDVSLEYVDSYREHSIFNVGNLSPVTHHYDTIADLTHVGSNNYYHWMYETIPKIHLLEQSRIGTNSFILKGENLSFQSETLSYLNIRKENIINTYDNFHIEAENLVVPSQPLWPTKWAYDFLRNIFLKEFTNPNFTPKRIYISRNKTRRILNEDQLIDLISKYGFIKFELENMSVVEQVKLFSGAEFIIAPHGAGLTNLTFSIPGTKVLEIFPPTFIHCYYWLISSFGNLDYNFVVGDFGERDTNLLQYQWPGYDNISLNINLLEETLKRLL
jgi:hypothetical protein